MEQSAAFVAFIRSLRLRHFEASELVEPPRELWRNYVGVLTIADQAREELGYALSISERGSYRDPETNREAGGGKRSRHQLAEALDLSPVLGHLGDVTQRYGIRELHGLLDGWRKEGRIFALQTRLGRLPVLDRSGSVIEGGNCWQWMYHGEARQLPAAFRFRGGLGLYPWGVHVDTRGRNATWKSTQ